MTFETRDVIQLVAAGIIVGKIWQTVNYLKKNLEEIKVTGVETAKIAAGQQTKLAVHEQRISDVESKMKRGKK